MNSEAQWSENKEEREKAAEKDRKVNTELQKCLLSMLQR